MQYGLQIEKSKWTPRRSLVGDVEVSASGNVIVRVGRENESGWEQSEHVVLSQAEALNLALELVTSVRSSIDRHQLTVPSYYDTERIIARNASPIGQALSALRKAGASA